MTGSITADTSRILCSALSFAENHGFKVLPVGQDKKPRIEGGLRAASSCPDVVRNWWVNDPDAQVAIACAPSGLVVVDIDDRDAFAHYLEDRGIKVPDTVVVETPSGGLHLYFRARLGAKYPGKLCDGVDVKHNGYVLAPPSRGFSSRAGRAGDYSWKDDKCDLADAPAWIEKPERQPKVSPMHSSALLGEQRELLEYVDPDLSYSEWVSVLMALHDVSDGSSDGLALAVSWSCKGTKFRDGEVEAKWKGFTTGSGVGPGTIAHLASEGGANLSAIARKRREIGEPRDPDFDVLDLDLSTVEAWPEGVDFTGDEYVPNDTIEATEAGSHRSESENNLAPVLKRARQLEKRAFCASSAVPILTSNYLIKGWMLRSTTALFFGPSGVGKSFVALSLAQAIASGCDWNGCRVHQGTVVYLSAEGAGSFQNRVYALGEERSENLIVIPIAIDLHSSGLDADALIELVRANVEGKPPLALVVIDTLARSFGAGEENSSADMGRVLQNVDKIRDTLNATVLVVHHTGKDHERGARGSSSLKAAVETEIEAKKGSNGGASLLRANKQRDLESGSEFAYELEQIELGKDPDGDPVTSCRVKYFGDDELKSAKVKLTKHQKETLQTIKDYIARSGEPHRAAVCGSDELEHQCVDREDAVEHVMKMVDEPGKRNARQRVKERIKALIEKGFLVEDGPKIWIV